LTQAIGEVHEQSRGTYGSPRVHAELRERGQRIGRNRVARLMRLAGIRARERRRFKSTTNSKHDYPVAPNVLNREFTAQRPDEKWLADMTYVATAEGWLYLATVLDVFSRQIVGWAMDSVMDHGLVAKALDMALLRRQPSADLLHHSDRGSQYAAHAYQDALKAKGITVSMSGTGNCYDNAMMESFFATLKAECVTQVFNSRSEARSTVFEYIEVWYNRQRRHSALGYLSPAAFEQRYTQAFLSSTKPGSVQCLLPRQTTMS
jgi:transposase InsO family protein